MAKTKNIAETKIQIMDIVMISSDIWINKLAELMLDEYGKSKTLVTPAYKQLVKSGNLEVFRKPKDDYPNRRYLRIIETTESQRIKNHIASIEITRQEFVKGIRILKKRPLLTKFTMQYEHLTISKGTQYKFINDRPTWKKGEKVSAFNNPEFLKGKLQSSNPLWLDVSYNPKSYRVFNGLLHLIENLFNQSNTLMIGLGLGHFDKMYEKTINSQYKKALNRIQWSLSKLIDSFDEDQRDFIDNLIQQKFTWFEPLYEIFDKSDRFKRDYVDALPSRI